MFLYLVPATGSVDEPGGVRPDLPVFVSWAGVYNEDEHVYVLRTEEAIEGLTPLEEGEDVGFDYSPLTQKSSPAQDILPTSMLDDAAAHGEL